MGLKASKPLGTFVEILAYTLAWISPLNFALIAGLYYEKLKVWLINTYPHTNWDWFNFIVYCSILIVPISILFLLELLIIYPARQKFRNEQEISSGSPLKKDLEEIKKLIKNLEAKDGK